MEDRAALVPCGGPSGRQSTAQDPGHVIDSQSRGSERDWRGQAVSAQVST